MSHLTEFLKSVCHSPAVKPFTPALDPAQHPKLFLAQVVGTDIDKTKADCYVTLKGLATKTTWPFTQQQYKIFLKAHQAQQINQTGLGCFGYTSIVMLPAGCTAMAIWAPAPWTVVGGFLAVICSNVASMVYTGSLPSLDSDHQNQDQNVLSALKSRFDNLGEFLLDECAYGDRQAVIDLAAKIDVQWIKAIIGELTTQPDREEDVLEHFDACVNYINDPDRTLQEESGNMLLLSALRRKNLLPRPMFLGPYRTATKNVVAVAPTKARLAALTDIDEAALTMERDSNSTGLPTPSVAQPESSSTFV